MRFLHAADLHLDSPLRGLDRYEGAPVTSLRSATRRAFQKLVDVALSEAVDFVLLAGDLYDQDWQDFHTGLFFHEQMVQLERAGILVFIVQGNHDAKSVISRRLKLPQNVQVFPSRKPETFRIAELEVAIHGRSFPHRKVEEDWVPDYPEAVAEAFNIGMLHTSLGGRPGHDSYAPTTVAALAAKGYDYWALGHVHRREQVAEAPHILFPGNLQGRHANETGPKGAELVTVEGGRIETQFLALDVVRWHQIRIPLDRVRELEAIEPLFRPHSRSLDQEDDDRLHALRVILTGATPLYHLEAREPGTLKAAVQAAAQEVTEAKIWIEQVRLHIRSPFDRQQAARREDAIGELVRLVEALGRDEKQLEQWVHDRLRVLLGRLPAEVRTEELPSWDQPEALRALLLEAESTVLARLSAED